MRYSIKMVQIKQRNDPVRLLWRRLFTLVLMVIVFFGMWAVWDVLLKERESRTLRKQAEAQLKDLETRETGLTARISTLETERGQEAALRGAYQVGREGEGMITIVEQSASTTSAPSAPKKSRFLWW